MAKQTKSYKKIPLHVFFELTEEKFTFCHITSRMTIRQLKGYVELETGVPFELQVLHYLDSGDLPDEQILKKLDIVPNAVINMEVWHTWKTLVEACCANDIEWLQSLGVTKDTQFSTPTSDYMLPKQKKEWIQKRANTALFIACHRNHHLMAKKILQWGADINGKTQMGRSPLHVAAAKNNGEVINLLLENGANVDLEDCDGYNPLTIASQFGHKGCERRLFLFRWQQRAKSQIPQFLNPPLMEFQCVDSAMPKWKCGKYAQIYMQKLIPPGEYIGSAFHAPRRNWHRRCSALSDNLAEVRSAGSRSAGKKQMSFQQWIQVKEKEANKRREEKRKEELVKIEEEKRKINEIRRQQEVQEDMQRFSFVAAHSHVAPNVDNLSSNRDQDKLATVPIAPKQRYRIDPTLSAYEQWLKDRSESAAGLDQSTFPYQLMIKEFCQRKCLHHHQAYVE